MTNKSFSMSEAIRFGWEATKANLLFLVGVIVLTGIIGALPGFFQRDNQPSGVSCVLGLISLVLNTLIGLGLTKVALDLADRQTPQLSDLWAPAPLFLNYLLAEIVFGVMFAVGLVLFIVPGIIVAVVFGFYAYVIVHRGAGPIESLSRGGLRVSPTRRPDHHRGPRRLIRQRPESRAQRPPPRPMNRAPRQRRAAAHRR